MAVPTDNENWLIDEGDRIIEKKSQAGRESLTARERLIYCLWVTDYGMRNAGDLQTAADLFPEFQTEGLRYSRELRLPLSTAAFSLERPLLEKEFLNRFESLCAEIRGLAD